MFLRTWPTPLSFPGWPTRPRLSSLSHSRCRSGPTRQRSRRLPCADRAAPPALSPAGQDQPPFSLLLMPPPIALTPSLPCLTPPPLQKAPVAAPAPSLPPSFSSAHGHASNTPPSFPPPPATPVTEPPLPLTAFRPPSLPSPAPR
jgi:hypothetical protein